MSARHLRGMRVRIDPTDHGYSEPGPDRGEVVIERDPDEPVYSTATTRIAYQERLRRRDRGRK